LLKYQGKDEFEKFNAISMNLSPEGISILSDLNIPVGEKFKLKFKLVNQESPISAECEVKYSEPKENKNLIGCKILHIEGIDKDELAKILERTFKSIDI